MSPPLTATKSKKKTKDPAKPRKPIVVSEKRLAANRANAKLSRGPVSSLGKSRSRTNACKHNLRAKLPILPGEDADELARRLELWPQILEAETEIEHFEAEQAVHIGWRRARSRRSEDATARRRMMDIKNARVDRQAEEARLLGLELDSDLDPETVVRKLQRSPAGCLLLLKEWSCLQTRSDTYDVLFWSQRERLFHLLGKRLRDFFTDDPVITAWVLAMLGTAFGDAAEGKAQALGEVLEGLRPAWMGDDEFQLRMEVLAAALPGQEESTERVRSYVDAAISDLNARLTRAEANARRELKLELMSAWVDDSASGARRLNYALGHERSYHAAFRRLDALQKNRRAGGGSPADDPEDGVDPEGSPDPEASPDVETAAEEAGVEDSGLGVAVTSETEAGSAAVNDSGSTPVVTNDPVSPLTEACLLAISDPGVPSAIRPPGPVANEPTFALPNDGEWVRASGLSVGVTIDHDVTSAPDGVAELLPAAVTDRLETVANEPTFCPTNERPPPILHPPALSPVRPLEAGAKDQGTGEPPPDRPSG
jgi:hypothetical protein